MYIFMYIVSCYDVKDVHYSFSTNIHLHKMHYINGRWRREEGEAATMIKSCGSRKAQICYKIDALEDSSETACATVLLYLEKGESLYPTRRFPDI